MHHNGTMVDADMSRTAGLQPNNCSNAGPTTLDTSSSALWNPCRCGFLKSAEFKNSQTSWSQTPAVHFSSTLYVNCSLETSFCGIGGVAWFPWVSAPAECGVFLMPMWLSQTGAGAARHRPGSSGIGALALNTPAAIQVAASGLRSSVQIWVNFSLLHRKGLCWVVSRKRYLVLQGKGTFWGFGLHPTCQQWLRSGPASQSPSW